MAFIDDFSKCLSPLPTPAALIANSSDVTNSLISIARAWRAAGGTNDILLQTLVAIGAVTGIDEAALTAAGGVAVVTYISLCASCAVTAAGPLIWVSITSCTDPYVQNALTVAANDAGVANPTA